MGSIVTSESWEYNFMRVYKNLVQHPSSTISNVKLYFHKLFIEMRKYLTILPKGDATLAQSMPFQPTDTPLEARG